MVQTVLLHILIQQQVTGLLAILTQEFMLKVLLDKMELQQDNYKLIGINLIVFN
jgi:hypothetical protein